MRRKITKKSKPNKILPIIYISSSKKYFFLREQLTTFVLKKKCVPLNPFMLFNYFLNDKISHQLIYIGNENLLRISDEIWVFGDISDGVAKEIFKMKNIYKKPVKYFSIVKQTGGIYKFASQIEDSVQIENNSELF